MREKYKGLHCASYYGLGEKTQNTSKTDLVRGTVRLLRGKILWEAAKIPLGSSSSWFYFIYS